LATLAREGKLKMNMDYTINAKELRALLPKIVERTRKGDTFVVLYRSRPAFRVVPVERVDELDDLPLEDDPLYRAEGLVASTDGKTSADHDDLLYGD
jgi:prevent-host-death family protein